MNRGVTVHEIAKNTRPQLADSLEMPEQRLGPLSDLSQQLEISLSLEPVAFIPRPVVICN